MIISASLSEDEILYRQHPTRGPLSALSEDQIVCQSPSAQVSVLGRFLIQASVERQLAPLTDLASGWDSYGAPPIDAEIVRMAQSFLVDVNVAQLPLPYVVPTSKGGLSLEWHRGARELVVEMDPGTLGVGAYFSDVETGQEWDLPFPAHGKFVPALMGMGE